MNVGAIEIAKAFLTAGALGVVVSALYLVVMVRVSGSQKKRTDSTT